LKISNYLNNLVSKGRYYFTLDELKNSINLSLGSIKVGLSRLKKKGEIASPVRGYYIIIPLEYRSLGSLPPDHFIPDLMKFLNIPYYVGLLSAAACYGAAHQQPQSFQVMLPIAKRDLTIGKVRVTFHKNKYLRQCPIININTPMSILSVSSPEATALDLIAYPKASAGFSNILTVLSELVEKMEVNELDKVLNTKREAPVLQRLGYLVELLGLDSFTTIILKHLRNHCFEKAVLNPSNPSKKGDFSKRWKLIINEQIESDL